MFDENYQIELSINDIIQKLKTIPHHHTSIFFMGESGAGKGTLINYLIKNTKLYSQLTQAGEMIIKYNKKIISFQDHQQNQIQIGSKMSSQTSIPKQIQYKGQIYKDFPGFHDNRQQNSLFNQDIKNQFFIKQVFTKTKKFKIVFTTSRSSLLDRAVEFLHSIKTFCKQFKNIKSILKSICLIVTKVPKQIQIHHVKASLRKIEMELMEQLSQNQKTLLSHFVEQSHIQLFYYPIAQGNIDFSYAQKIHKIIDSLEYSHSEQQICIHVQNSSYSKIHSLLLKWNNDISHIIGQYLKRTLSMLFQEDLLKLQLIQMNKKCLQKYLALLQELQGLQRDEYNKFGDKLFKDHIIKSYNTNKNKVQEDLRKLKIKFQQIYGFIQFFKHFDNESFNLSKWKEKIHRIKGYLYELVDSPKVQQHFIKDINTIFIYFKAFYCDSHLIQQWFEKHMKSCSNQISKQNKKIIVLSYILNLNSNITIPGTDLIFITNYLNIPNEITINLKGRDAQNLQGQQDANMDGTPGLPGQNSGSLIIKSNHHSFQLKKINIDLRGGAGGKGKNGGIIKIPQKKAYLKMIMQDLNKPTQNKQFLIQRANYKFSDKKFMGKLAHILRSLGTFNDQIIEKYSTINYDKQNFVETVGGCNGINGMMGKLDIGKIPSTIELKNVVNPEKSYGYKQVYEGVYLKQMLFPSIRKQGRTPVKQKSQIETKSLDMDHKQFSQKNKKYAQSSSSSYRQNSNKTQRSRSRKGSSSSKISEFSLDPQKQQQNNSFDQLQSEQKPKQKTFADSLNKMSNEKDLQTQLLISLFKFNDARTKELKQKELQKIEEKDEFNLIKRKPQKKELFKKQQKSGQESNSSQNMQPHFVRKRNQTNKTPSISKQQHNIKMKNQFIHSANQIITNHIQTQQLSFNSQKQIFDNKTKFPLRHSQTLTESPFHYQRKQSLLQNKLCRSLTFTNELDENKLRKQYLQSNIQTLNRGQLLQLIRIRTESKQKVIKNNEQRDKFALMISKELLNEFGKEIATDIGTEMIHNVGKDIVNGVTNHVVKSTGKQIGKQILIKSTQGIGKSYLGHELGKQTIKQFSQAFSQQSIKQISKKTSQASITSMSFEYGIGQTLLGISKSFILQSIISALLASGITDKWLVQPHFQSKKIENGDNFNDKQLIKPQKKQNIDPREMERYWEQHDKLIEHFDKIFEYFNQ